jgi:hypothetical protein
MTTRHRLKTRWSRLRTYEIFERGNEDLGRATEVEARNKPEALKKAEKEVGHLRKAYAVRYD